MAYIEKLQSFDVDNLPDLDVAVMGALELFADCDLPALELDQFKHPLVVGSGNAATCGQILFSDCDAVFATESTFRDKLQNIDSIDGVVIISASGSKHATQIATDTRDAGLSTMLLTNTPNSPAQAELNAVTSSTLVFPKNREPYTYNTSTYLGMILSKTGENPTEITEFIDSNIATIDFDNFGNYDKFVLTIPENLAEITPMLDTKFTELFGRRVARDIETDESILHAVTVVPAEELFIEFKYQSHLYEEGNYSYSIPLPDRCDYGAMMAIGYYVVGQIQKHQPDYFKRNIVRYAEQTLKSNLDFNIDPIVPGS